MPDWPIVDEPGWLIGQGPVIIDEEALRQLDEDRKKYDATRWFGSPIDTSNLEVEGQS